MSKQAEVRNSLEKLMRPMTWYSSEELMEGTGYESRIIYRSMKPWRSKGMVRKRFRGETRDYEYRLVR